MAWTTPRTWQSELVTVAMFNEQIRDNLNALKTPPTAIAYVDAASNFTTSTIANFERVDLATDTEGVFKHTLTTNGGDVFVGFTVCIAQTSASAYVFFNVQYDGTTLVAGDDGLINPTADAAPGGIRAVSWSGYITGLSAGSHAFRLMWRVSAGTGTVYGGAGTANRDVHPTFWAREIS